MRRALPAPFATLALAALAAAQQPWAPVPGHIATRFAANVTPGTAWPEYPRPSLQRAAWQNLNGLWDYAITAADAPMPAVADGRILVPFALESSLSGVGKALRPEQRLWYRRTFTLANNAAWQGHAVLLHCDAVDWHAEVFVDGQRVGEHRGGYDRFTFDVTNALAARAEHELLVAVRDPSDAGAQPRGKQVQHPEGIWYTPCSGIWQTVWLEPVPAAHVTGVATTTSADGTVHCTLAAAGLQKGDQWRLTVAAGGGLANAFVHTVDATAPIDLNTLEPWGPGHPRRYPATVELLRGGQILDEVAIQIARRHLAVGKDSAGLTRLLLNGEAVFQYGPLDQGFWPDGIYTPPSFAALCADLDAIAAMGCNMLRKHVKVECERFYDECDRRGLLVWQDMPSGDTQKDPANFEHELYALVYNHSMHPSIVMWVVFNEGWGQHDTERYVGLVRKQDPTRWIGNASGWTDRKCGDVIDVHAYPGPGMAPPEAARASVLGEFGGLGLPVKGHTWVDKDNWGYVSYPDPAALTDAYVGRLAALRPLIARGLCAAVYTQTTDVEIECNGWLTYDRAVTKIDPARAFAAAMRLYEPVGSVRVLVPDAEQGPQNWKWTTQKPADGWTAAAFDDAAWATGPGGFGTEGTPGAIVGTKWDTADLWVRRTIEVPAGPLHEPVWSVHHDEDAEAFLDGEKVFELRGYTSGYELVPVGRPLTPGRHVLAVHCHQTRGGQYLDVGLADLVPAAK